MKSNRRRISIISRESDTETIDVSLLKAELVKRGYEVRVLSRLLTKEKSLKSAGYIIEVLKQEAAILGSDVVILDTYCIPASMLPHSKRTKVVQIWHALGAIKKFGWQSVGRPEGSSEKIAKLMRMHRGYDYVACSSDVTARYFCEAFDIGSDKIVKLGLPRIDYIKSVSSGDRRDDARRRIYTEYPWVKPDALRKDYEKTSSKKTILYAPTFRRHGTPDADGLIKHVDTSEFNIVIKLHPLYRGGSKIPEKTNGCIYDDLFSSFEWLSVADIVISDYSSFVIEASLANKPLYIYANDLEEYAENTGINMDFASESISPYVFRDAGKLAEALSVQCGSSCNDTEGEEKNLNCSGYDMELLYKFRDKYIDIDTSHCTSDMVCFIESIMRAGL